VKFQKIWGPGACLGGVAHARPFTSALRALKFYMLTGKLEQLDSVGVGADYIHFISFGKQWGCMLQQMKNGT